MCETIFPVYSAIVKLHSEPTVKQFQKDTHWEVTPQEYYQRTEEKYLYEVVVVFSVWFGFFCFVSCLVLVSCIVNKLFKIYLKSVLYYIK